MKTKYGIFLNLDESTYSYEKNKITFYFSSELYLNKFKKTYKNYIQMEIAKLNIKYNLNIEDFPILYNNIYNFLLRALYKKIEKRGYKICTNEME